MGVNKKLMAKVQQNKAANQGDNSVFKDKSMFSAITEDALYSVTKINFDNLKVAPENTYGVNQAHVDELANGIASVGLLDFLVVEMVSVKEYHILSGQKRFLAIKKLKDEMNQEEFEKLFPGSNIPCRVIDYSKLHLKNPSSGEDLSVDNKRKFIIAEGNQQHEKTVSDYMLQVEIYTDIYMELKEKNLAGGMRLREFAAEKVGGIQSRSVQKVINARNNMIPELWAILKSKDILEYVNQLQDIANLPKEKQQTLLELIEAGQEVDFQLFIKADTVPTPPVKPEPKPIETESSNFGSYQQQFTDHAMADVIGLLDDNVVLDPKDKAVMDALMEKYEKLYLKAQKIVKKYQKREKREKRHD